MSLFDVNISSLVKNLVGPRLRGPKWLAWLRALTAPVASLYARFGAARQAAIYNLAHNGQVCRLQAALNDAFDEVNREIYIEDAPFKESLYIYKRAENKPRYLHRRSDNKPLYIYRTAETEVGALDFIVFVPAAVAAAYEPARIAGVINAYRLASKKYAVTTF